MIGKIIIYMRKTNRYSQEELGRLANLGRTTISDYERNKTEPSFDNIEKIANICGYEVLFQNKITKEIISSKNIQRKEV